MKEYLLISRGNRKTWDTTSETEWETVMRGFETWIKGMDKLWVRGDQLSEMRTDIACSEKEGFKITDGPFTETKEALSGFFIFKAENMKQAVELSKGCPSLLHDSLELYEMEGDRE